MFITPETVGLVAAGEFENALARYKPRLAEWAQRLPTLSDEEFVTECAAAIFDSAHAGRFRGNFNHEHFKASACHHEAQRRLIAAGHSADCCASGLYAVAHAQVMREHGSRRPRWWPAPVARSSRDRC